MIQRRRLFLRLRVVLLLLASGTASAHQEVNVHDELESSSSSISRLLQPQQQQDASTQAAASADRGLCYSRTNCIDCTSAIKSDGTSCFWFTDNFSGYEWCGNVWPSPEACNPSNGICASQVCKTQTTQTTILPAKSNEIVALNNTNSTNGQEVLEIDEEGEVETSLFGSDTNEEDDVSINVSLVNDHDNDNDIDLQVGKGNSTFEVDVDEFLLHANITKDEEGIIEIGDENITKILSEIENEDGTKSVAEWTFTATPGDVCTANAIYCIPVSKFHHLPFFTYGLDNGGDAVENAPEEPTKQEWKKQIKDRCLDIHIFLPGFSTVIARALVDRYKEFYTAKYMIMTAGGDGVDISMYAIGAEIFDIANINYLSGTFTVDLRVYIFKVTNGEPYDTVTDALKAGWTPLNHSSVAKATKMEGHTELLDDEFLHIKDRVGERDLIMDGRCSQGAYKSLKPVSLEEFNGLSGGIRILRTPVLPGLKPMTDSNGNILYLEGHGSNVKFQPVNSRFYPFQVNLLDLQITSPAPKFVIGEKANVYTFCIAGPYTGFKYPIPSLPDNGQLSLIPSIKVNSISPWFNSGNDHMHLDTTTTGTDENDTPEKYSQGANFRIVYYDESFIRSWMTLLPFMFTAFTTQLQWLTTQADKVDAQSMITSVLLIQNLVNSQSKFTGYHNIATEVIYLTYAITGIYVTAIALMAFINLSRDSGEWQFLTSNQLKIFRLIRLVGLLVTPLYIPVLAIDTNPNTGEQHQIIWLWPVVGALVLAIFVSRILLVLRGAAKEIEEQNEKGHGDEENLAILSERNISTYSAKEVKHWISTSKELADVCPYFDESDFKFIANKFEEAKIDGNALLRTASDPKMLNQAVGLPVGQAIGFSDGFNGLIKAGAMGLSLREQGLK